MKKDEGEDIFILDYEFQKENSYEYLDDNEFDNYDSNSYKLYLKDISRYPLLSSEQQDELLLKYQETHDSEIFDILYKSNLRLSIFVAKKCIKYAKNMTFLDLIQENNITLIKAIKKFDPSKGTKLSTYVIDSMVKSLTRKMNENDNIISRPSYIEIMYNKYLSYRDKYYEKYNKEPSKKEIMDTLEITEDTYDLIINHKNYDVDSLNKKINLEDSENELESTISSVDDSFYKAENEFDQLIVLKAIKDCLDTKYFYVFYYRIFASPIKSLDSLSKELNLTRARIGQIEMSSRRKIKPIFNKIVKKTATKYSLKELSKMELIPKSLPDIALFHYLKNILDDDIYFMLYKTYFNKDNNINYYKKYFSCLSNNEIKELMLQCNKLLGLFNQDKKNIIYKDYISKYSVDDIFGLNIKPKNIKRYKNVSNMLETMSFNEIETNSFYQELSESLQNLIKEFFVNKDNNNLSLEQKRNVIKIIHSINIKQLKKSSNNSSNKVNKKV